MPFMHRRKSFSRHSAIPASLLFAVSLLASQLASSSLHPSAHLKSARTVTAMAPGRNNVRPQIISEPRRLALRTTKPSRPSLFSAYLLPLLAPSEIAEVALTCLGMTAFVLFAIARRHRHARPIEKTQRPG